MHTAILENSSALSTKEFFLDIIFFTNSLFPQGERSLVLFILYCLFHVSLPKSLVNLLCLFIFKYEALNI